MDPPHRRARVEDNVKPTAQALDETLASMWQAMQGESDKRRIEVEVRIGMILLERDRRWKAQGNQNRAIVVGQDRRDLSFHVGGDRIFLDLVKTSLIAAEYTPEVQVQYGTSPPLIPHFILLHFTCDNLNVTLFILFD